MDKKILACLVVIIVLVAALAVVVVYDSGDDDDDDDTGSSSSSTSSSSIDNCYLWIYGNVNADSYIDQEDIDLLEKILAGEDYEVYVSIYDGYNADNVTSRISFADANGDGTVDEEDLDYIQEIIDFQENYSAAVSAGTLDTFTDEITLYYNNCDNEKCSVHLPINTLISVYFSNSEVVRLLGATDRVVATDSTTLNKPTLLPEFQSITTTVDRFSPDAETVLATGADAYFTGSSSTYAEYLEDSVGDAMDVIRLPAWEDNNIMAGVLTLGYMLGATDTAYEYIEWACGYVDLITERVDTLSGNVTTIVPKGRNSCLEGNGLGSGQYEITELAGAVNLASMLSATDEYPAFSIEWALSVNPQFIVLSGYAGFEKSSEDDIQTYVTDVMATAYETYEGTYAAENGQIYFIANEIFTGPSSIIAMVYCATWFYPDLFSDLDGFDVFQEYIDLFVPALADYDLSAHIGQFVVGPE